MSVVLPRSVRIDGRDWAIERVWPGRGGDPRVTLEARASGAVRGGYADADGRITLLAPDDDARLPALGAVVRAGRLVAHRPGRRAVVRLASERGFAKVAPPGRARRIVDAHGAGRAFSAGFRVPRVLAHGFEPSSVVRFDTLSGRSLGELGGDDTLPETEWVRAWGEWSEAWLATMAAASPGTLPAHGAGEESEIVRTWADHASGVLGGAVRDTAERAVGLLRAAGAATALSHRDLHDGQLLWHPTEGMGLIDFDTCVRADPGLDLGNLAAHADFAVRQGRWSAERARVAVAAVRRTAEELGVDAAGFEAWRVAALVRVACVNALRPRWITASRAVLADIGTELGRRCP